MRWGRRFERLEGPVVIFLAAITVAGVIVGAIFVNRHEAQLLACEAELRDAGTAQNAISHGRRNGPFRLGLSWLFLNPDSDLHSHIAEGRAGAFRAITGVP